LRVGNLDDTVDEDAGRDDMLGSMPPGGMIFETCTMVLAAAMHISGLKLRPALL